MELVKRADDSGFDMIVTADHLAQCLDPLPPLAIAAELSDRLRLGTMVLNNDFHHPSLLPRDVATLDLLSDGRMELASARATPSPTTTELASPSDARVVSHAERYFLA